MAPRPLATPAFLAEHYLYEINMLRASYALLSTVTDQALCNALIEAFAVHARILMDFFASPPRNDDAGAAHFTASGTFTAISTKAIPTDIRMRLNKQITHLTYSRTNARKIGDQDRRTLLRALEADHAAFKREVAPQLAGCFTNEWGGTGAGGGAPAVNVFYIS